MNRVHSVSEKPVDDIEYVADAVKAVDTEQRHLVILHRAANAGDVFRLELAWHHDLRNSPFQSTSYLWVDPLLPRLRARQVAAKCRQIWRANGKDRIPYGFSPPTDCFDDSTYEYLIGPSRYGLTCSSFVLAVFEEAGVRLLEYESWPIDRPQDEQWQRRIADRLAQEGADSAHVHVMRNARGVARFRPEEVAAGATQTSPCSFADAEPISLEILQKLPPA